MHTGKLKANETPMDVVSTINPVAEKEIVDMIQGITGIWNLDMKPSSLHRILIALKFNISPTLFLLKAYVLPIRHPKFHISACTANKKLSVIRSHKGSVHFFGNSVHV